jgi:beta-mannosidase
MHRIIFLFIFSIINNISIITAQTLLLNGNDWKIKDIPNDSTAAFCSNWIPATVPGNIQSDLEAARILKPIWYGAGDKK